LFKTNNKEKMKLTKKIKTLADKTKIKTFVLSIAPEDLKIIYEGLCFAQLHYLNLLQDANIIKHYFKSQLEFNRINLTIEEFKKQMK
jgi:hypothetical protein